MRDSCLFVFTKPASPGRVKTRLIAGEGTAGEGLTARQAADLHQAFLEDVTGRLRKGRFDLTMAWALESGAEPPMSEFPSVRQSEGDLGERLFAALSEAASRHRLVGAVGSDHPEVSVAEIERGFALLRGGVDLVLGPAADGGYYFVGVRSESLRRELFSDIEWSTPRVLETTLERARKLELSFVLLEECSDVDTPADLEDLKSRMASSGHDFSTSCPRTAGLLRQWSLG